MPKLTKEKARALMWERGNLSFKLHEGQDKIEEAYRQSEHQLFVGNCSRRLGKTFWACLKAVEVALTCELPFPRIIYASDTKRDLKQFAIPTFEFVLFDCPDHLRPTWVASQDKYVFPHNGAEIHLVGLDKRPDGGRGNHCDLYVFEEAGMINKLKYLYASVVSPMMITRKGSKIIMISTPAVTPSHPFQTYCTLAKERSSYVELTIHDNPMLSSYDIARIKKEAIEEGGESTWLREYMCQHVVDENLAIVREWKEEYEREARKPEYYDHLHKYVSMDLGTKRDLTAVLYGYWDNLKQRLVIEAEDEINGPEMTTIALKDLIVSREKELWRGQKPYRRISDNDNPLLIQDLGALHGLHFVSTGKDELHAMINEVRLLVKAGRIVVSPRCAKLIGCLRYGVFQTMRRKTFGYNDLYGHFDHLASLIYMVRNLDRTADPIPMAKRPDEYKRMMLEEHKKIDKTHQVLQDMFELPDDD